MIKQQGRHDCGDCRGQDFVRIVFLLEHFHEVFFLDLLALGRAEIAHRRLGDNRQALQDGLPRLVDIDDPQEGPEVVGADPVHNVRHGGVLPGGEFRRQVPEVYIFSVILQRVCAVRFLHDFQMEGLRGRHRQGLVAFGIQVEEFLDIGIIHFVADFPVGDHLDGGVRHHLRAERGGAEQGGQGEDQFFHA